MNFGSKKVYVYNYSDEESVSDDSDNEETSTAFNSPPFGYSFNTKSTASSGFSFGNQNPASRVAFNFGSLKASTSGGSASTTPTPVFGSQISTTGAQIRKKPSKGRTRQMKRSTNVSKDPPGKRQLLQNSTATPPYGKKAKTTTTATSGQSKTKSTAVKALPSKKKASRALPTRRSARLSIAAISSSSSRLATHSHPGNASHSKPGTSNVADKSSIQQRRRKVRKADGNVFTVNVGDNCIPGEYRHNNKEKITCQHCLAVANVYSNFQSRSSVNAKYWLCELCNTTNEGVDNSITDQMKPLTADVTYELEPPPLSTTELNMGDNHNIVFVIDISVSMEHRKCDIWPHVSRLETVKKAALHQIKQIRDETPNVRVGLVTFGTEITIYGDTTYTVKRFTADQLGNIGDALKAVSSSIGKLKPIRETYNKLTAQLSRVSTCGCTALGPALLASVAMAGSIKGSKVIICTDGQANVGIGSLPASWSPSEQEISDCRNTYRTFGEAAKQKGVSVSVVSFEGADCKLVHLGLVADMTGGVVDIVSLNNLDEQFGNILTSRTLATDVTVRLCLHNSLYIRNQDGTEQSSVMTDYIGNVDADKDLVIEFGVKSTINREKEDDADVVSLTTQRRLRSRTTNAAKSTAASTSSKDNKIPNTTVRLHDLAGKLPFQVQFSFTSREGGKYLRVITNLQDTTRDREEAEDDMDINILGVVSSKTISKAVLTKDAKTVRDDVKAKKKMATRYSTKAKRSSKTLSAGGSIQIDDADDYVQDLSELDQLVRRQQQTTKSSGGFFQQGKGRPHQQTQSVQQQRHVMSDTLAKEFYNRSSKGKKLYAAKKAARRKK